MVMEDLYFQIKKSTSATTGTERTPNLANSNGETLRLMKGFGKTIRRMVRESRDQKMGKKMRRSAMDYG
jgi:hypothetical protein